MGENGLQKETCVRADPDAPAPDTVASTAPSTEAKMKSRTS